MVGEANLSFYLTFATDECEESVIWNSLYIFTAFNLDLAVIVANKNNFVESMSYKTNNINNSIFTEWSTWEIISSVSVSNVHSKNTFCYWKDFIYLLIFLPLESVSQIWRLDACLLEDIGNPTRKLKLSMFDISKDGGPVGVTRATLTENNYEMYNELCFN